MIKTFVEFAYPAILFSETSSKVVKNRRTPDDIPKGADAYRFYDASISEVICDGEKRESTGKRRNVSGWFYPGGTAYTKKQALAHFTGPQYEILRSNIDCNDMKRVCVTRRGRTVQMYDGDVVGEDA